MIYLRDCHQASVSTGRNQSASESPVDRSFIVFTPRFCETAVLRGLLILVKGNQTDHRPQLPHQHLVRVAETERKFVLNEDQSVKIYESFKADDGVTEREVQTKTSAVPDRTCATSS